MVRDGTWLHNQNPFVVAVFVCWSISPWLHIWMAIAYLSLYIASGFLQSAIVCKFCIVLTCDPFWLSWCLDFFTIWHFCWWYDSDVVCFATRRRSPWTRPCGTPGVRWCWRWYTALSTTVLDSFYEMQAWLCLSPRARTPTYGVHQEVNSCGSRTDCCDDLSG